MAPQGIGETLITQSLDERAPRSSDANLEIQAYCKLAQEVVEFADDVLKEIAPLARDLCHAGSAGISLLETDPAGNPVIRWEAVAGQLEPNQGLLMPRDESPCGLCTERRAPLLFARPASAFQVFEPLEAPVLEYLVVPLRERGERSRGALWVAAHTPDRKFDATDRLILERLGHFTALALHMLDELKQREMLVYEMNHRVKNSLQLATSLLSLQAKRLAEPLQEELQIASQRIQSIARVHELLQQGQEYKTVAMRPYLDSLCRELARMQQQPGNAARPIDLDIDEIELPTSQTIALGIIVTELVFNAMKHGARQGQSARVAVRLHKSDDDVLHLAVDDDGDGLSADFDLTRNAGVGMQLVRAMTAQLHGSLRPVLDSRATRFEITFPYRGSSA
jgi:two-component sensor histidine kinase